MLVTFQQLRQVINIVNTLRPTLIASDFQALHKVVLNQLFTSYQDLVNMIVSQVNYYCLHF